MDRLYNFRRWKDSRANVIRFCLLILIITFNSLCWCLAGVPEVEVSAAHHSVSSIMHLTWLWHPQKKSIVYWKLFIDTTSEHRLLLLDIVQCHIDLTLLFSSPRQAAIAEKSESIDMSVHNKDKKIFYSGYQQSCCFLFFVSDRAKVTKGLPDVVAIREDKVCHCQGSTADTTVLLWRYTHCCDIVVNLLCEAGLHESHCGCAKYNFF